MSSNIIIKIIYGVQLTCIDWLQVHLFRLYRWARALFLFQKRTQPIRKTYYGFLWCTQFWAKSNMGYSLLEFLSWHLHHYDTQEARNIYFLLFSNNIFITSGPWTCGAPAWSSTSPSPELSLSMKTRISTSRSKMLPSCKFFFFLCSRIQLKSWHKNKVSWLQNLWYHGTPGTHRTPGRRSPHRQSSWSQTFCRWNNR